MQRGSLAGGCSNSDFLQTLGAGKIFCMLYPFTHWIARLDVLPLHCPPRKIDSRGFHKGRCSV